MKNYTFSTQLRLFIGNLLNLKFIALSLLFVGGISGVWGQNSFNSGDGWGAGWGIGASMSASAGSSLIYT
ncbi:MAG: hypothetical protein ACKN86_04600, partial [Crocinitomicaceae bacterium]